MASRCNRFVNRASVSSLKSAIKSNLRRNSASVDGSASSKFPLPARSTSSPLRRLSLSRCPSELGCVQSLLPLHSAVAAARMTSRLSVTSRSSKALSQGVRPCSGSYFDQVPLRHMSIQCLKGIYWDIYDTCQFSSMTVLLRV
ncbi:hypothetical protein RHMOL_Rhmol07G0131200 [Rhododendron molle]|uniref:Uncharacterized protein n=1 Tax=Rhododendron molle TaxID=49168 RepID=A0ACC0N0B0_RHOML|nr:hypothetical protein RHMOL_Rhmol07G0131200 [Rhododendron molle]